MKKVLGALIMIGISMASLLQVASAVLQESVKVAGTSFSVGTGTGTGGGGGGTTTGNTSLKILTNLTGGTNTSNLSDSVAGPTFTNVGPDWMDNFPVKVYNKGTVPLNLVALADYINDPDVLRDDIYVKIVEWNDSDNDGLVDTGEEGQTYGYDTILRLRNDTFGLGTINPSQQRGFVMKFDGTGVSEANANMNAIYDFVVTGTGQ